MNVITGLGIPVDIVMPQVTQDIVWILFVCVIFKVECLTMKCLSWSQQFLLLDIV
jgi:hypothetical protein